MTTLEAPRRKAAIYSRLSRETISSTSIQGQSDDLLALAEREGWEVAAMFVDEGLSGGKKRANAEEALRMLRDGEVDVLAAYSVDRYSRLGIGEDAEVIRVVDAREALARSTGAPRPLVYFAREGIRSDSGSDWRLRFALSSEMARNERDLVSSRQTAARDRMRRQGRNAGHGVPPFGYRTGPHPTLAVGRGLHVIPEEADVVRELAERLIAGESTVKLADELNARGIPKARSAARVARLAGDPEEGLDRGKWNGSRVRATMTSDHLLGRVSHNGSPLYGDDGQPLTPFEPILSLETMLALRERFDANRRGEPKRRASGLLSKIAFCSGCDRPLYPRRTSVSERNPEGHVNYGCSAASSGVTCPRKAYMSARKLDAEVVGRYLAAVGDAPQVQTVRELVTPTAELADIDAQLRELSRRLADTDEDRDVETLTRTMGVLRDRRRHLRALPLKAAVGEAETGRTWAQAWEATDNLDERRRMLLRVIDRVVVHPVSAPLRVELVWVEGASPSLA
jgi:DNA invertase Pin-like site-specific DNA recombinase